MADPERYGALKQKTLRLRLRQLTGSRLISPSVPPPPEPETETVPAEISTIVTLQVGERRFTTTGATLTSESGFFSSMLSGHWHNNNDKQPDGSYFVDADPELFAHILRYLRHGMLPIFYVNGHHEYGLYAALLGEARYFQVDRLVGWLERKRYLDAVKIERTAEEIDGMGSLQETTLANQEIEYHPFQTSKKVYVCPRGIWNHRGNPRACGRMCQKARGDDSDGYEEEEGWEALVIRKKVVFNHGLCVEG